MYGMKQKTMKATSGQNQDSDDVDEEENSSINNCRTKICEVLEFIIVIQNELRFNEFLGEIKHLMLDLELKNPGSISQLQISDDFTAGSKSDGNSFEDEEKI